MKPDEAAKVLREHVAIRRKAGTGNPCVNVALDAAVAALEVSAEPVAYMHNKRADVIHTSVKSLLSDFSVNYGPESMLRPIDKSEHYTIPLYAAPVPAQPAADVAAIAKAVRGIPSRIESLGGQRFAYVKLSEVIDTIYSMAGKHSAVPDDKARSTLQQCYAELRGQSTEPHGNTVYAVSEGDAAMSEQTELELLRIWKADAQEKMAAQERELSELTDIINEMQAAIDNAYRPMRELLQFSKGNDV